MPRSRAPRPAAILLGFLPSPLNLRGSACTPPASRRPAGGGGGDARGRAPLDRTRQPPRQGVHAGGVRRPSRHHHRPRRRALGVRTAASAASGASPPRARSPRSTRARAPAPPASPPAATAPSGSPTATSAASSASRRAARSPRTRSPPRTPSRPTIVAGPDGALWFTEIHGNQIGRITTERQDHRVPDPDPRRLRRRTSPSAPTARSGSPSRAPTRSAASPPPAS